VRGVGLGLRLIEDFDLGLRVVIRLDEPRSLGAALGYAEILPSLAGLVGPFEVNALAEEPRPQGPWNERSSVTVVSVVRLLTLH
jgi:hypothetical protein